MDNKFKIIRFDLKGQIINDDAIKKYEIKNDTVSNIINRVNEEIIANEIT